MTVTHDAFGDRMKLYEQPTISRRADPNFPLFARLDGQAFHTFTRGLVRPFDVRLTDLMIEVMKDLVNSFNATIGFTQSDEISLVWCIKPGEVTQLPFGGRFQKLESLLAAAASVSFMKHLPAFLPEKASQPALFDCRAFTVPSLIEAANNLLWRQCDCMRNAVSMAAHATFSHSSLQGMPCAEMEDRLLTEAGIDFSQYAAKHRRGTFARRQKVLKHLTPDELSSIPEKHRPTGPVERSEVVALDILIGAQVDRVDVLFNGAEPQSI